MKITIKGVLIGVVLLVSAGQAFAYPPDNAAVLYYKAFMLKEEPNDALGKILAAVGKGEAKPDDQVRRYVERNRRVIKYAVAAADISHCDWGYDLSEGISLRLPELAKCKQMANILIADARMLAEKDDYKEALERCVTVHKMGIHVGNDTVIQVVISSAISGLANKCIVEILPQVSNDIETLQQLRTQLADISGRVPSMRTAIGNEAKFFSMKSTDRKELLVAVCDLGLSKDDVDNADKIFRQNDENEFYVRVTEYYQSILSRAQIAYDLPYPQTKQALEDLNKEIRNVAKEKPEAVMAGVLFPVINRFLTIDTRDKTQFNAVLAGLEIYIIRAKTGKLPDELPAGLPKDLFSGKDFLYEKTGAGFTLTGQGKGLDDNSGFVLTGQSKDIVHKYEFKVAK
jgi:GrpB-like predicted nucleotidyltransferase (UPF0157 family)